VMDDPNSDRTFFRNFRVSRSMIACCTSDLHRDMDHVMKIRAHYRSYGDQRFRITRIYGAELDFGLAGRRDSSALLEWQSVDSLFVSLPIRGFVSQREPYPSGASPASSPGLLTFLHALRIFNRISLRKWRNWQTHHLEGVAPTRHAG